MAFHLYQLPRKGTQNMSQEPEKKVAKEKSHKRAAAQKAAAKEDANEEAVQIAAVKEEKHTTMGGRLVQDKVILHLSQSPEVSVKESQRVGDNVLSEDGYKANPG